MKKSLLLGAMILLGSAVSQVQAGPAKGPVAAAPAPAAAAPMFTYDYLDIQYIYTKFDSHLIDNGHGAGANLSKSLGGPLYLTGSFAWSDTEIDHEPVDLYGASGGLGVYYPIMDRLHVNFEGGALWAKDSFKGYSEDDWGYFVGPGVRFAICQGFELFANVYYSDFGGSRNTDSFDLNVGAIFDVSRYFGIKVGGIFGEDQNSAFVGGRIYY